MHSVLELAEENARLKARLLELGRLNALLGELERDSDGCTWFPDGENGRRVVCLVHDDHYRAHDVPRFVADVELLRFVAKEPEDAWIAVLMFLGVRLCGWYAWARRRPTRGVLRAYLARRWQRRGRRAHAA